MGATLDIFQVRCSHRLAFALLTETTDPVLDPLEHNRFRSGSASTSEGTIESGVVSRMRERDADAMAEYVRRRDQRNLEIRRDGESRPDGLLGRQRSGSSSSSGAPESSVASGVSGGNLGFGGSANGSQSQMSGSGNGSTLPRLQSGPNSNKTLPPPPTGPALASQFSTPTQFPTPLQSQFSPSSTLPLGSYTQHVRNHPIAGEPMPPPASPGRRLRAVASANALGAIALAQAPRPKRAGTNEGLGTSPGQAFAAGRSMSAAQSRSGSNARPPPAMPPPSIPPPSAPPPTPPSKPVSASQTSISRETPKREMSGSGRETPKSGRETPKSGKDGKETPGRSALGLRAGVVGVVKPMLSPSALNGSFFSRGDKSSGSGGARTVEASR